MTPASPAHVVFDCDGVLVDSEPLSIEVDRQMLAELGWELTLDEIIERFVGRWVPKLRRGGRGRRRLRHTLPARRIVGNPAAWLGGSGHRVVVVTR
jgi:beta-phosphoglucomutase-like phosphatase (HAD superfamily)